MNITPVTNVSIATVVNPQTDTLRRENNQREVISQPAAASQAAAEKGVASERDRAKNPGQNNEKFDFDNLRKQAEIANGLITEQDNDDAPQQQSSQQQAEGEQDTSAATEQKANKKPNQLSEAEQEIVDQLQQRDREVRAHEMAHASTGGTVTGAPTYSYEVGPDGKKYAVAGEVSVDLTPVEGDPRATIVKMQKVYNAALAPVNPSIQDTRVANSAAQLIAQAQSELLEQTFNRDDNKALSIDDTRSFSSAELNSPAFDNSEFDTLLNQTILAQEQVSPSRASDIDARADRIENYYATINKAFEKPATNQFELTA
jgi:hypothetical protein